jgi:hypothetical protein
MWINWGVVLTIGIRGKRSSVFFCVSIAPCRPTWSSFLTRFVGFSTSRTRSGMQGFLSGMRSGRCPPVWSMLWHPPLCLSSCKGLPTSPAQLLWLLRPPFLLLASPQLPTTCLTPGAHLPALELLQQHALRHAVATRRKGRRWLWPDRQGVGLGQPTEST